MIDIKNKVDCCGCNACGDICSQGAITFHTDIEGFWYPEVDKSKCTDCGLCEKVCPQLHIAELKKNDFEKPECFAAIHKNLEIRFDSTSGGLFSALAENTYKEGGYVGGAIFNDDFSVRQFISSDKSDLSALRSSKYLQSDAQGFYKAVRDLLRKGNKVLVCGTPCQMAALRAFLMKDYDNLIIVDFICRGINSPKVFRKYLDYLEDRFQSKVVYFKAKNKELGWRQLTSKVVFENGKVLYDTAQTSYFTIGYLQTNVYCRPSCYECKYKGLPRVSDITVADFWGAEKIVGKELDNDLGTSIVLLNSKKGQSYFDTIRDSIILKQVPLEVVVKGNPALMQPLGKPRVSRDDFYRYLNDNTFGQVAEKFIQNRATNLSFKHKIKNFLRFCYHAAKSSGFSPSTYYKNVKYNLFCKRVKCDVVSGNFLIIHKCTILEIHPKATVFIKGLFDLGYKKFPSSRLETRLLVEDDAQLLIDNNFALAYGSDVEVFKGAILHIEGNSATNINSTIICANNITLGRYAMLGRDVTIRDNNGGHFINTRGYKDSRPVTIGQHAWLCEGCTIISGAKIGDGAIVGAKSLVFSHIPAFSMVSGNPAQIVDEDICWKY